MQHPNSSYVSVCPSTPDSSTPVSLSQAPSPHSRSADEEASLECIEAIKANPEDVNVIKKASDKEKKWWIDGNYKAIDEERLPLRLMENVTYREYEKKSEIVNAGRFWEFDDGVVIIYELPNCDHEVAHTAFSRQFLSAFTNLQFQDDVTGAGATTCLGSGRRSARQADTSFVPNRLPIPSPHPSDAQGNPWPTVVCEVARCQSLPHILQKTNSFWLAPNRSEDVIVLKLWPWNRRKDTNGRPLRRLTCYKFCRRASLQAGQAQGRFQPVQTYEFGTIDRHRRPYNGCSAQGILTVTIAPECVYEGCTPPYPPYPLAGNVTIDLSSIQQAIFRYQGQ
ncbi:1427_t:CDS:2 [Acaulospora morrowiae]|uniref:1427_t:CDS:1 n=1 Tax=Acaulospora morrowiae TaxID=94023 RepID=A0A9N8ZMX2_9GLOM|nr:1427_t:CDS:2 [Acaulospora morrowiae]